MEKILKGIILFLFIIMFCISAFYFNQDFIEYYKVKKINNKINTQVKKESKIDWNALWNINKNIVAWIEIPETSISYPIVQTTDNNEYLNKDIQGNNSRYGAIFLDERLYGSDLKKNPNNIIYGHNMGQWTDVMFGTLKEYLDKSYLKGHETVILYTPDNAYYYRIVSVEYGTEGASVYQTKFNDNSFPGWIKEQKNNSLYKSIDEDVIDLYISKFMKGNLIKKVIRYGNTLTLSTCDTTHDNNRKIVVFCIPSTIKK